MGVQVNSGDIRIDLSLTDVFGWSKNINSDSILGTIVTFGDKQNNKVRKQSRRYGSLKKDYLISLCGV